MKLKKNDSTDKNDKQKRTAGEQRHTYGLQQKEHFNLLLNHP